MGFYWIVINTEKPFACWVIHARLMLSPFVWARRSRAAVPVMGCICPDVHTALAVPRQLLARTLLIRGLMLLCLFVALLIMDKNITTIEGLAEMIQAAMQGSAKRMCRHWTEKVSFKQVVVA